MKKNLLLSDYSDYELIEELNALERTKSNKKHYSRIIDELSIRGIDPILYWQTRYEQLSIGQLLKIVLNEKKSSSFQINAALRGIRELIATEKTPQNRLLAVNSILLKNRVSRYDHLHKKLNRKKKIRGVLYVFSTIRNGLKMIRAFLGG